MNDLDRRNIIESDIALWDRKIIEETEVFERRIRSRELTSDPTEKEQLDRLIWESDKALRRLSKQKRLAETRLIRIVNGYID